MAQPRTFAIPGPVGALAVHDWNGGTEAGDGAPILLAHPTGFHGRVWAPVAERLVAAGRRVWSLDFRGHGDSYAPDPDGTDYVWDGFAGDALAVIDHLGLGGEPGLVAAGHSKGATALLLGEVRRPGTYPRIWAFEPIVFATEPAAADAPMDDFPLARSARRRRNEWASIEEAYEAYSSKPPLNVMTAESLRAYVEYGLRDRGDGVFELKCRPEVEARTYSMAPSNGTWAVLPRVNATVVVACGEVSTDIGPRLAEQITRRLPDARLEVWPGCGHFGPQQDPGACAASILRFAGA
ncbi:MAG TPA: alpha/beta hydrolase [Acidimicrobiia bacterium]|nr:alpha/beta hydrolase [Acidimicrobiia bacterium]